MFHKKQKTLQDLERELVLAKSIYDTYSRTFLMQSGFTDRQRRELVRLRGVLDVLEFDINQVKFKEVVHGSAK